MNLKGMIICCLVCFSVITAKPQEDFTISRNDLLDKIKGGWAGQTIGVTYGAPVEFRYLGSMINDYQKLEWYDGLLKKSMTENPGIYDDLYMDITFVEVFDREGLDAPVSSHADAFAHAGYMLWHANQAARYNLLHGIPAPASGNWLNNPHADCIDYQIESDFAGVMSPGMPNTASAISDRIGHIMNYGDGWYGGVFVGAMYSLACTSKDIDFIVKEALKTIPASTGFHRCISDVIRWHQEFPSDWKAAWFEIQKKWTDDTGCPEGVFSAFNIDAKVNAAYVVLGLLYGEGDFGRSLEIATRCGQDADCNPSTVGGILGTILGYKNIPSYWKKGLNDIEDIPFKYTGSSLHKVYRMSYDQALENVERNGGSVHDSVIHIRTQAPEPVKTEQGFTGLAPAAKIWIGKTLGNDTLLEFTGCAFVLGGEYRPLKGSVFDEGIKGEAFIEVSIDGEKGQIISLPLSFTTRRTEIAWNYQLEDRKHVIRLKYLNPDQQSELFLSQLLVYSGSAGGN